MWNVISFATESLEKENRLIIFKRKRNTELLFFTDNNDCEMIENLSRLDVIDCIG